MVVPWAPGQTAPAPETVAGLAVPRGTRLVVQLAYDTPDPALPQFAASLVAQVPAIQDLIVGAPGRPAAEYAATLAGVYDAVRAVRPDVRIAGTASTPPAVTALGAASRATGRAAPPLDELAFRASVQADYGKLAAAVQAAFGVPVPILWDGIGTVTRVPPAKAALYGAEATAPGAAERDQASAYAAALKLAACQPTVAGVLLDRLQDSATPGARDGLLYPDGTAKSSLTPLRTPLLRAQRGTLAVCPGLAMPAVPTALAFPATASLPARTSSWSVQLGCSRDCLYLVTLERENGVPMLARRGSLAAGAPPATVTLPRLPVPAGTYRLRVRLVARVNPGTVVSQRSDPIQVVPAR
jgi:hypothetical protein